MKPGIIINPDAGFHRRLGRAERLRLVKDTFAFCSVEGDVAFTEGPGTARTIARRMIRAGTNNLVVWGGDGTINEVASEAIPARVIIGIVPSGSGNGLARELSIERSPVEALRTALRGSIRNLDVGQIDGRVFVNVAGIGFDAHLAGVFNRLRRRGSAAYMMSGLHELLAYVPGNYSIEFSLEKFRMSALILCCANGRHYGSGAIIAPNAKTDDGKIELVCIPALSRLSVLWNIPRLFFGTVDRLNGVRTVSVDKVEIGGEEPLFFHVDGEVFSGGTTLQVSVLPKALCVRVPRLS